MKWPSRLLLLLLVSLSNKSYAARFWVAAAASNWNNTANWSNVSGGATGFSVPGVADDVTFDNNGLGNCTIDAAVSIKSLTVAALYPGTITQGANTITTLNAGSFAGGVFTGGSANITIAGVFTLSGTAFTSTSAVLELDNNAAFTSGTFTHNSGTVFFNGLFAQTISGTSPVFWIVQFSGNGNAYNITSAGAVTVVSSLNFTGTQSYTINTGTINVSGDINSSNTNTGCGGNAQINIIGAGAQNLNGNAITPGVGALPQLNINKASGTLTLNNFSGDRQ